MWLAILFATTVVMHHVSPARLDEILGERSTNVHNLSDEPAKALFRSALWIDGDGWLFYVFLFSVFHATAERWLGTWRWLAVVLIGHVAATYISQGVLLWAVRHGQAPETSVDTLDVGVSYSLAAVEAVLTYFLAPPWRYFYAFCVLGFYGLALVHGRTFTDVGHFTAALLGLACYPLTRGRPGHLDPAALVSRALRRISRAG
ncbi:hypothetical protein QMK19_21445 [Streptomyces sp. H10-C2]|uniref:rhomboid-like protein n=1 Tax=unclassified Streptomyces TaxID=2593676 RepID=UPI0024BB2756|nr:MULTISPECIES: rhomboid-like protein [unclassified Streptomyces]MDJ0342304.1 hypothetical protein [Streptomyces sp. PH10-H1]MDJ0372159.1 hypothetical protein [Streptomyces sp. H10-C2]